MTASTEPPALSSLGSLISDFGPALALIGAIVLFFLQRRADRNETRLRDKQELYRKYLRALADDIGYLEDSDKREPIRFEVVRLRMELLCIASDEVANRLEAVSELRGTIRQPGGPDRYKTALAELMIAMRRDGFPGTEVRASSLAKQIPISVNHAGEKTEESGVQ